MGIFFVNADIILVSFSCILLQNNGKANVLCIRYMVSGLKVF